MTTSRKLVIALSVAFLSFIGYQVTVGVSERRAVTALQSKLRAELKVGDGEEKIASVFRANNLRTWYEEEDHCFRSSERHRYFLLHTRIRAVYVYVDAEKKVRHIDVKLLIII
jgi:hypothetical protein